jgi:small subunit ribosomal protein S11
MATAKVKTKKRSGARRKVKQGIVHIQSSYNNTIISVTDPEGAVLTQGSAGQSGFSGARKATPFAAQKTIAEIMEKIKPMGFEEAHIRVKGIGGARDAAIRAIGAAGITILSIRDITPIPHNGVRPPKRRRV